MLDHVFTDAISALREAFEGAFLERQAFEEHFQMDVLLGDLTWETSYGLPGVVFDAGARGSQAYVAFAEELVRKMPPASAFAPPVPEPPPVAVPAPEVSE